MPYKCYFCEELFSEDMIDIVDEGVGPYEYGSIRGYHSLPVEVSPCCGEDFYFIDVEEIIDKRIEENANDIFDCLISIVRKLESDPNIDKNSEEYLGAKKMVSKITEI